MDQTLRNSLKVLGCHDKHARLYRAALEAGSATLPELAKIARIRRSTAYTLVDDMLALKLLTEDHRTYAKRYTPVSLDTLHSMIEAKKRQLGRNSLALKESLPELRARYGADVGLPKVRTYEGNAGLASVWADILSIDQEILLWTNQETECAFFSPKFHGLFIDERIKKGIHLRVLAVDNSHGQELLALDKSSLRQTKILPPNIVFTSEVYVYGNKVATIDYNKGIFGVITENKQIADFHRTMFEQQWASIAAKI
jgi:HTH-type transcriptional regulator, sugar sensing transcriptional regulator